MRLIQIVTKSQIKNYLRFIKQLYRGDENYVCTAKFSAEAILYSKTDFARSCFIHPVAVINEGKFCAVCTYIKSPALPYLQIGLFEAEENADAVKLIIQEAKRIAAEKNLKKIVIGLNGHLSYGVGILEDGFETKISFDSIYNKPYYKDLFSPHISEKQTLSAYRECTEMLRERLKGIKDRRDIAVRAANLKKFPEEIEIMRRICDETIGTTFLYESTQKLHFEQLTGALLPFLNNENLLFSLKDGRENGFLFWHPDYNTMLCGGRNYNLLQIFFKARNAAKKSDTVKFNAIGVKDGNTFATAALIRAAVSYATENYKFAETNFVWDNNEKSTLMCRNLFGEPIRKYAVYFI